MSEIVFLVEEAAEGGYTARALGESIFTEADDWETLKSNVIEAVGCHYADRTHPPKIVRLHLVKDEVLTV